MPRFRPRLPLLLMAMFALLVSPAVSLAGERLSVLVCSMSAFDRGSVDLQWLRDLHAAGFAPDFLESHEEFSWERVRDYDVLLIFGTPPKEGERTRPFWASSGPWQDEYVETLERFLEAGGGVFCMVATSQADRRMRPLLEPWGVRLPLEWYRETDDRKIRSFPRMRDSDQAVLVDQVLASPISDGVDQLWWPYIQQRFTSLPGPIDVSDDWQVVVRGSATSHTEPIDQSEVDATPIPEPFQREGGVEAPALLALREYRNGRIVLMSQWPQFSVGSGTQWLYNRRVLSRGFDGIESDFEQLLHNSFRWLGEPARSSDEIGGYEASLDRLQPPNRRERERIKAEIDQRFGDGYDIEHPPVRQGEVYRGLFGARTALSVGEGSVADYAEAARSAGLDYVVFLEPFAHMDAERYARLEAACREHSDDELLLIPGYTIRTNIGNRAFFYGEDLLWPPDRMLTGPDNTLLNVQYQDEDGEFGNRALLTQFVLRDNPRDRSNAGYFDFREATAPAMPDLRLYSSAAVMFYENGELVEDRLDDYLTTAQGTIPPQPISVNLVDSPEAMRREVEAGHALTYVKDRRLDRLVTGALRFSNQYGGPNVFHSTGPIIESWPSVERTMVYASEPFVLNAETMPVNTRVTSDAGLAEIRIYNGEHLLRRFQLGGAEVFDEVLYFPRHVQQNLVLIAEDVDGGRAVSFARRTWKDGSMGFAFCGDHINDCGRGLLAKGPGMFRTTNLPEIDGGVTWDGGPRATQDVWRWQNNHPNLVSDRGEEPHDGRYNNLPLLETTDDQVAIVRSKLREVYDEAIPVVNSWRTYGPIHPAELLHSTRRYSEFNRPIVDVAPTGHAFRPERRGAGLANYQDTIEFQRDQTVEELLLLRSHWNALPSRMLVIGGRDGLTLHPVSDRERSLRVDVDTGEWFGFYAPTPSNAMLMINRGEPIRLEIAAPRDSESRQLRIYADLDGQSVEAGDTFTYEWFSVVDPVDQDWRDPSRFLRLVGYLDAPDGLYVHRGERVDDPGFVTLEPDQGVAELEVSQLETPLGITLPVRVGGMNPRWSTGLFQRNGYTTGFYTDGRDVYTAVGTDLEGYAYASLYPDQANWHVALGHPVVCDAPELAIAVTPIRRDEQGYQWQVAVNNPTDEPITATFHAAMALPGLELEERTLTIEPGGREVLVSP